MNAARRWTPEAEKPGRLQLAIQEWQRQLIQKREVQQAETPGSGRDPEGPDGRSDAPSVAA